MQELKFDQVENVSGGFYQYIVGWAVGEAINHAIRGSVRHAQGFSGRDHSASNEYFKKNQHKFNAMI
ncbi:hypothetical protein BAE46_03365 [Glaciecola punicea]|jgi:hypothetical protein|uniref:hypothetical protein n=1 Tax=Glaciecola punicea TaxID=56804 RepID=UPI000871BDCB|nr:hypothetical protein [Glaciecola punicea]OFA32802.1 hypothetical protein BAE46_03365 [Glaciecola punicea]